MSRRPTIDINRFENLNNASGIANIVHTRRLASVQSIIECIFLSLIFERYK